VAEPEGATLLVALLVDLAESGVAQLRLVAAAAVVVAAA
jgi:hypothetical protein